MYPELVRSFVLVVQVSGASRRREVADVEVDRPMEGNKLI
jgi:hypothetical protein